MCKTSKGCWTSVVCSVELLGHEGERHSERGTTSSGRQVSDTKKIGGKKEGMTGIRGMQDVSGKLKTFCLHSQAACKLLVTTLSRSATSTLCIQLSRHATHMPVSIGFRLQTQPQGITWPPEQQQTLHKGSLAPYKDSNTYVAK